MGIFDKLSLAGIVPVIKVEDAGDAVPLCEALTEGGLPVAEITFRTDAAERAIQNVHRALPEVMLGAGTVLTVEQVRRAVGAGAAYIVSPGLNPEVTRYCLNNNIPVLPGCATPTEVEQALSLGIHTVKFFPAEALGGLDMIKAISAPYGSVRFVPTGGVNEQNALQYLADPKVVAVGGSWMVPASALREKDWARVRALARSAVDAMLGLELKHLGVNSGSDERALKDAKAFCDLLGWPLKEGGKSNFAGAGIELMKNPARGANGHIAIATNSLPRARWQMERKGYVFDEESANIVGGVTHAIYLKGEIAGFAVHLLQK